MYKIFGGLPLEGISIFPSNIIVTSKKDVFILNNEPLLLNFNIAALNYYALDFLNPSPSSIPLKNSYRNGLCDIPYDFVIVSYDITDANGTLYVAFLDGYGARISFFPLKSDFSCDFSDGFSIPDLLETAKLHLPFNTI